MRVITVVAGIGIAAGLMMPGVPASARAAAPAPAASASANLYVSSEADSGCSDGGSGTADQPFCTIAAAAAIVQPGQTVVVEPGNYSSVTISRSGTPGAPITFLAATSPVGLARVGFPQTAGNGFLVSAAHDVVISGFDTFAAAGFGAFGIENSSDITINGASAHGGRGVAAVRVTGTSSNVTISRVTAVGSLGAGVQIDPGVTGAVITSSTIVASSPSPGVLVTGAPGTVVTGNTLVTHCGAGVTVTGTSPGTSVEDNIVETASGPTTAPAACAGTAPTGIEVSAAATAQAVADYNLIDPASGGPLYNWGGTSYTTLASFRSATGQGAHDIAADAGLAGETGGDIFWYPLTGTSPAIDSAAAAAPGELASDLLGNPRADDPAVPDTGTGPGYYDRGAVELEGPLTFGGLAASRDPAGGPLDVTAAAHITTSWTTNGPIGTYAYSFSDTRLPVVTRASSIEHSFTTAGEKVVGVTESATGFLSSPSGSGQASVVVGADYTPVTPARILDTRSGLGVAKAGAIPPGSDLVLPVASVGQVSSADISAIVANVTVTQPTAGGALTVYSAAGAGSATSNINFSAHESVPDLVTVQPVDGVIRFHNGSGGTVQVIADLEGYYGSGGQGFGPLSPVRVLDTRSGIGTSTAKPVAAHGRLTLDLSGKLPAGADAAVLNVTVTQPTAGGFLTAFPDGQPLPTASNLDFARGQTVPNLVAVPLVNGKADFSNGSGGTVQLVADLDGYFGPAAADSFVPYGPARIVDTRVGLGASAGAVPAHGTLLVAPSTFTGCVPVCPLPTAAVLNVTAIQPKASGYLTVYPHGHARPTSSSVNFSAAQTVSNLVTVQDADGELAVYNGSSGPVQLVVDEQGYYIGPP